MRIRGDREYYVNKTYRVNIIYLFFPFIIFSLNPMSVQILTNTIEDPTRELILLPNTGEELED